MGQGSLHTGGKALFGCIPCIGNVREGVPCHGQELYDHHKQCQGLLVDHKSSNEGHEECQKHDNGGNNAGLGKHLLALVDRPHEEACTGKSKTIPKGVKDSKQDESFGKEQQC